MDDDHRDVHRLGDAQQPRHGLRLQIIGAGLGVTADAVLPCRFLLRLQGVDNAAVLTMDAADAAHRFQLFQRPVHRLVADHHGRIGHIHLK